MPRFRIESTVPAPSVPGWLPVDLTTLVVDDPTKDSRLAAEKAISEVLQCDQVVVLAGLGSSLCIKDPANSQRTLFPTMGNLWEKVKTRVGHVPFQNVQQAVGMSGGENIEELLSRCQMKLGLDPATPATTTFASPSASGTLDVAGFVRAAEEVIRTECRKTLAPSSTETHEEFLRRLVRRGPRRPRANVFTTNYDLCFETAASRIGLPVIDGFAFSNPARFQPEVFDYDIVTNSSYSKEPDFVPRLVRLFKLHGSVDWHPQDAGIIKKADTETPLLIYPQAGKYAASYSPPFLEVMSRFQGLLRQRNVGVLAVCCGFNDLHIAEPALSAVKSNPSLRMVVCAPDLCPHDASNMYANSDERRRGAVVANPTLHQFNNLIDNGDNRLTLVNGFFPDLVRLMPSLSMQSDSEQHEARIKKLEAEVARLRALAGGAQ